MSRIRPIICTLILAFIVDRAPWRLGVLVAETLVLRPNQIHTHPTDNDGYWEALAVEARLIGLGFRVAYTDLVALQGDYGQMDPMERLIQVDKHLGWSDRHCVLAHEGGHVLAPPYLNHQENEVFAEMVSALACRDGVREHARYLSDAKLATLMVAFLQTSAVYRAADMLEDR